MITLVIGPPCGGKTTYVSEHAQPGDVVIDFDAIARELGSPDEWRHGEPYWSQAYAETEARIAAISTEETAWVIRCAPDLRQRAELTAWLAAEVVVCDPGEATCLARARTRPSGTRRAIRMWYWRQRRSGLGSG